MSTEFMNVLKNIIDNNFKLYETINLPNIAANNLIDWIESTQQLGVVASAEGLLSTVENKNNVKDWGKNNSYFPFHLDGGYYPKIPRYVILYCIRPSHEGGNTFFSDAESVISYLEKKYDKNFLNSLNIVWMSSEKKKYRKPLIEEVEGGKQFNWFSSLYIEPNEQTLSEENRRFFTKFLKEFMQDVDHALEQALIISHHWKEGDLLIFNNQKLLHGREAASASGDRLLFRIWFDKKPFVAVKNPI